MIINGKQIKVYTHNKEKVFLAYDDEMKGVIPLESEVGIGAYPIEEYKGCSVCQTSEEAYGYDYDDEEEIVSCECVNPENSQRLLPGWWSLEYAIQDEFCRTFLVTTDHYYDWRSERSMMIDKLHEASEGDVVPRKVYAELKSEWDEHVRQYCHQHQVLYSAPFDELLAEAQLSVR